MLNSQQACLPVGRKYPMMIGSGGQAQMDIACRQAGCWTFDIQHAKEYNEPFVNLRVFES